MITNKQANYIAKDFIASYISKIDITVLPNKNSFYFQTDYYYLPMSLSYYWKSKYPIRYTPNQNTDSYIHMNGLIEYQTWFPKINESHLLYYKDLKEKYINGMWNGDYIYVEGLPIYRKVGIDVDTYGCYIVNDRQIEAFYKLQVTGAVKKVKYLVKIL